MDTERDHPQSLQILKGLVLEIQDMSEFERLKTLELMVRLESEGKGSRLWLPIVKALLAKPELGPKALNLVRKEMAVISIKQNSKL